MSINDVKVGDVFGNWTVLEILPPKTKYGHKQLLCKCACGNVKSVDIFNVIKGKSISCGCVRNIATKKSMTTHGKTNTRLHYIWVSMKDRCNNPNDQAYAHYGGRGISVCQEWNNDFVTFYEWAINNGYDKTLTIDRIDVNGNYEPSNCRWADKKTQANNKRNNIIITYNNKTQSLKLWCEELNLDYDMIRARWQNPNWENKSVEEKLFTPNQKHILITYNGETHTISEWAKITNIRHNVIFDRWQKGYYEEDILYKGSVPKKYGGAKYIPKKERN